MKIATLSTATLRRLALSLALMVVLGMGWSFAAPTQHSGERTAHIAASHILIASGVETHGGKGDGGGGGGKHRTVSVS